MAALPAAAIAGGIGTASAGAAVAGFVVTTIGAFIDNAFLFPRLFGEESEPASIGSVDANYAEEGTGAQFAYGNSNRIAGQYIYVSKPYSQTGGSSGGLGKRGEPAKTTWFVDAAVAFCWNEVGRFNALLFDGNIVYRDKPGVILNPSTGDFTAYFDKTNSVQEWTYQTATGKWLLTRWYGKFVSDPGPTVLFNSFAAGDLIEITDTLGQTVSNLRVVSSSVTGNGTTTEMVIDLLPYYSGQPFGLVTGPPSTPPTMSSANYPWAGVQNPLNEPWVFERNDNKPWKNNLVNEAGVEFFLGKNQPQVSSVIGTAFGTRAPALPGIAYVTLPRLNVSAFGSRAPHVTGIISQSDNSLTTVVENRTADQGITYLAKSVGGIPAAFVSTNVPYFLSGLAWSGTQETYALLAQVMLAYGAESYEKDGVRTFRLRRTATAVSLDPNYLATRPSGQPPRAQIEGLVETDRGALPRRLNIRYPSLELNRNLQKSSQHATRDGLQDAYATDAEDRQVELAIPMLDTEARALAATMLQTIWDETGKATIRLPWTFAHLQETDIVNLTSDVDGRSWSMAITEIDHTATFEVIAKVSVRVDNSSIPAAAYGGGASTYGSESLFGRISNFRASTAITMMVLDIPAFRHEDAIKPGLYIATGNPDPTAPWRGAQVYMSTADNAQYYLLGYGRQATTGHTGGASVLGTASASTFDAVSSVNVRLLTGGPLSNVTQAEAAEGRNLCVIGNEVCAFTTATLQGDGSYVLSGFYRGRLATEDAIALHTDANERFVILDDNVVHMPVGLEHRGKSRDFQVLEPGEALNANPDFTIESYDAVSARSAPVANIQATREDNDDVTITWDRRSRVPTYDLGPAAVPLPEYIEGYVLRIDNASGTEVREVTQSTTSYSYTTAQQIADGTDATDFTIRVVQVDPVSDEGREVSLAVAAP